MLENLAGLLQVVCSCPLGRLFGLDKRRENMKIDSARAERDEVTVVQGGNPTAVEIMNLLDEPHAEGRDTANIVAVHQPAESDAVLSSAGSFFCKACLLRYAA